MRSVAVLRDELANPPESLESSCASAWCAALGCRPGSDLTRRRMPHDAARLHFHDDSDLLTESIEALRR
jgi:hypothetical protein